MAMAKFRCLCFLSTVWAYATFSAVMPTTLAERSSNHTAPPIAIVDQPLNIDEVYAKLKRLSKLTGEPPVFQGDIILNDKTVDYLAGRYEEDKNVTEGVVTGNKTRGRGSGNVTLISIYQKWRARQSRAARRASSFKWPNATVIYEFARNYPEEGRVTALKAMKHWESKTCIRFQPKKPIHKDYVMFRFTAYTSGCNSAVGRIGGLQEITTGRSCYVNEGNIIHEIGHTVGFWHEHSRPDRDKYIRIEERNVIPGYLNNFQKISLQNVDSLGTPYDYHSIMHYRKYAFSRDGRPTISVLDSNFTGRLGQRVGLSAIDIKQANLLYGCFTPTFTPPTSPRLTSTIYKDTTIALKIAGTTDKWMACTTRRCNVTTCPGTAGFQYATTRSLCQTSILKLHPIVSKDKPLAVSDHVMIKDDRNYFMICEKTGPCKLSQSCLTNNQFSSSSCYGHILQVNVTGKRPGEYIQEGDRITLVYSSSQQQWVGSRNGKTIKRLYAGIPHRNSIIATTPPERTAFQVFKITV